MSSFQLAIVGGGAAGTLLALHVCRYSGIAVTVYDRDAAFGRGIAYSAQARVHCLNVPAIKMGGWHGDEPEGFLAWLSQRTQIPAGDLALRFIERSVYGDWLSAQLQALADSGRVRLEAQEVVDVGVSGTGQLIYLGNGQQRHVDAVVLCTGNFAARGLGEVSSCPRYVPQVWRPGALDPVRSTDSVMIVGSGASGVDAVLELLDNGHQGVIQLLSRRGLLPQPEKLAEPCTELAIPEGPAVLRNLFALVRRQAIEAERAGRPWQAIMDALLPQADSVWAVMTLREKKQFLRHLRPYWMTFRHRADPAVLARLKQAERDGRLQRIAGRLKGFELLPNGLRLRIAHRRGGDSEHVVDWLLSAMGPEEWLDRVGSQLIKNLLNKGWAVPGPASLRVAVTQEGRLLSRNTDMAQCRIYALGLPTRGTFWEVTSVPALRGRAALLAQTLAALTQLPSG